MPRRSYRKTAWPKPPGVMNPRLELGTHGLGQAAGLYLEWLAVHGFAVGTVHGQRLGLTRFIRWCEERAQLDPGDITQPILERYQKHLYYYRKQDGGALTLQSQARLLIPLKGFFKWLTREHYIRYNPASELTLPKTPRHLPRVILSVAEVEAILCTADPRHIKGLRDRAMLETLYSTGVRRAELCALKLYDVDTTRNTLFVHEGKGKKDRMIPIGARACAWVEKYLTEARPQLLVADHDYLFVTDYGAPLTPKFAARTVKVAMQQAAVDKPGGAHLFRHAMATHMLENGADTRFIQAMLGHARLETTQVYTHVSIEKLKQIHAATHPAKLVRVSSAAEPLPDAVDEG